MSVAEFFESLPYVLPWAVVTIVLAVAAARYMV